MVGVVVSAEVAHPEIKTAVRATAAKAANLFFIAVVSELAGKVDGSWQALTWNPNGGGRDRADLTIFLYGNIDRHEIE